MPLRDGDLYRVDRILSNKTRPNARAYIDEKNLQIHVKEVSQQDPVLSFSKIVNDITSAQIAQARPNSTEQMQSEKLSVAMDEAQRSFDAMMEFHSQIRDAYQRIVEMK